MNLVENQEKSPEKKEKNENDSQKTENEGENDKSSSEDDHFDLIKQNIIPMFESLYPPIKDHFVFDEVNEINNNILQISRDNPDIRYKKRLSIKNIINIIDETRSKDINKIISKFNNDDDLKLTDEFLEDLLKIPCPISKERKIRVISNFIRNSKLIKKIEDEYQSDKKADLNNLSILCAENLFYTDLKKGSILFKIGELGNKFYIILKGTITILKLKEIPKVRMSFSQYFNYCVKLLKEKEIYILEEMLRKNFDKMPLASTEDLERLCKIMFKKKLFENLSKQLICNNNLLLLFFSTHDYKLEDFKIPLEELQLYEQLGKYKEWRNCIVKKIKTKKEDILFSEQFERFTNNKTEVLITCFCYEPFLYIGQGYYFGDNALEKGYVYTERRRNATIRAETDVILGWLNSADYVDIIAPKKRLEKLKGIQFLYNNFFFQEISIHLFEKNYFHLFSVCEYTRGTVLFTMGLPPRALIFIKEGSISLELKTSIINIQKIIKCLFEYIYTNPFYMKLSHQNKKKILNKETIKIIKGYIEDPTFKKLRGFSQNFLDELNKERNYKIAVLAENDSLGLQEIFLGIPYIMKGLVSNEKVSCYEITIEHISKILNDEKQIIIPYIKSSVNKVCSLIDRLQNIKQHYINTFLQIYEKGLADKSITNKLSNKRMTKNISFNNFDNSILQTENSEKNINNNVLGNNIDKNKNLLL